MKMMIVLMQSIFTVWSRRLHRVGSYGVKASIMGLSNIHPNRIDKSTALQSLVNAPIEI